MVLSVLNVFFLTILSLSLSGALTGMLLLTIRPLTGKFFPGKWNYYIWLLVILRLLLPVQLTLVLPGGMAFDISKETAEEMPGESGRAVNGIPHVEADGAVDGIPHVEADGGVDGIPSVETDGETDGILSAEAGGSNAEESSFPISVLLLTAEIIWMAGVIAALGIKLRNYRRYLLLIKKGARPVADDQVMVLARSVSARMHLRKVPTICESASVSGPVTVGLWKPVVILPEMQRNANQADPKERKQLDQSLSIQYQLILHHELVHVARRDLWYKWLYQLLLCIHWFNPFLYLFGRKMNMDCELSCDEAVLAELTAEGRKAYGNVLLDIAERGAAFKTNVLATTFVTGKSGLKKRLNGILHYKKTTVLRLLLSLCVMAGVMFLTACGSVYFYDSSSSEDFSTADGVWPGDPADGGRSAWDEFLENVRIDQNGEAYRLYDDAELLSGEDLNDRWQAYNYRGGGDKVTMSGFALNGSYSLRIVYAAEDTDIEVTSSFDLKEGRFKIVHIAPDGTISILNDTGEKNTVAVTMPKGRNVIKIVGQAAALRDAEITFSGLKGKNFENVYYSEEDEYAGQIKNEIQNGNVEKDKFMESLYYMEKEDISEAYAVLLKQGTVFDEEELTNIFIYSNAERSGDYLAEAVKNGSVEPLSVDALSGIIVYLEGKAKTELINELPAEDFFEGLMECRPFLNEEELEECLLAYIDAGGRLSYTQFDEIAIYLNKSTIEKMDEKMALPAEAGEPEGN